MATAIAVQASPSGTPTIPATASNSQLKGVKTEKGLTKPRAVTVAADIGNTRSRRDRPCDACRRRKSRCVIGDGVASCTLCDFHKQECTFVQRPQPRKRKLNNGVKGEATTKRRSPDTEITPRPFQSTSNAPSMSSNIPTNSERYHQHQATSLKDSLGLQNHRHSKYIGPTTELEPALIDLVGLDGNDEGSLLCRGTLLKISDKENFLMLPDRGTQNHEAEVRDLDEIEQIVSPYGPALINLYFRVVHPSFPILQEKVYLEKYSRTYREFSPTNLAAVYILALNWWSWNPDLAHQPKPSREKLEAIALRTLNDAIHRPKLSTVQAGLLLLQRSNGDSWNLTAQLVAVGQELGLHLDPTNWRIPAWERGLRKRLAWALYMQDKWSSLIHGRPSHIFAANWAVPPITEGDFPGSDAGTDEKARFETEKGKTLFIQMIALTEILAEVLDTFYTLRATTEFQSAERHGTRLILERAKPVQIKLKEWFAHLPSCLRMDSISATKLSSTGYIHLAYFATEITLHRRIVRSLSPATTDSYLLHICRSAAKTRLISAMDFVNRLKPEHLQSFWYFSSTVNFALISTFGGLLWATAPGREEAEFYKHRLSEYRWTLRVSSKGASEFLDFAVAMLDASTELLKNLKEKPRSLSPGSSVAGEGTKPSEGDVLAEAKARMLHAMSSNGESTELIEHPASIGSASGLVSPSTSTSSGSGDHEGYRANTGAGHGAGQGEFDFMARTSDIKRWAGISSR
ncbi:MAG: Fungal specific transcription factor [Candelina mexicana]|nr:MAG: Fungal specific transcription factor [Candelina mexicana]